MSRLDGIIPAALRGLRGAGRGTTEEDSTAAVTTLEEFGVLAVGAHSTDEEIADWEDKLWHAQDDLLDELQKEARRNLHYVAGNQHIVYHTRDRRWIQRKDVPWRIRSQYNILRKAVDMRVSRLTENKPTVTVQSATADRSDVEKAEYKETLFWHLWNKLSLHNAITRAQRWSIKARSGFFVCGWDPDGGEEIPETRMVLRYAPQVDPITGQPMVDPMTGEPVQEVAGIEEVYVDEQGEELGPVEIEQEDPDRPDQTMKVRQEPPEGTASYCEGEAFVDVDNLFGIRFDRYTDDIADSWYVQRAKILPASRIVGLLGEDVLEKLREASAVSAEDRGNMWDGLVRRSAPHEVLYSAEGRQDESALDPEYLVRETWIFPRSKAIKRLWGKGGALLITIGGKLITKTELPKWAVEACPFIQVRQSAEEGNHYGGDSLGDLIHLQDDLNRTRSMKAERIALLSRLLLQAPQNHNMNLGILGGLPGMLLTHRPGAEVSAVQLDNGGGGELKEFYEETMQAAADLGNMNDASTGKMPAAGASGKLVYALQYADERFITEASNLQDDALSRLARSLDAITRVEYKEPRKVRIVGADRSYLVEEEILPEHLDVAADYHFVPGSMLSRQKEAVKNEMFALLEAGLIEPWRVKKHLSTATPDVFRQSYDLQEARARRNLNKILRRGEMVRPEPFDEPAVHAAVYKEFMLTTAWEAATTEERAQITVLWQEYEARANPQPMLPPPAEGGPPQPGAPPAPPAAGGMDGAELQPPEGAAILEQQAEAAMAPPPGL